jgi:hypothetical protein
MTASDVLQHVVIELMANTFTRYSIHVKYRMTGGLLLCHIHVQLVKRLVMTFSSLLRCIVHCPTSGESFTMTYIIQPP